MMTTFTLQELNIPTTAEQAIETVTKEEFMEYGMAHPINTNAMDEAVLNSLNQTLSHAPEPQPTLTDIINTICTQLQLLTSVIKQHQPNTTPPVEEKSSSNESLQDCVATTLQQADWFRTMVRHELVGLDIEDIAKDAVESIVENEVESYFENRFDPSDHFDFGDAVSDCVSDQIDDVVSDKIDDAVDAYLTNATISISK